MENRAKGLLVVWTDADPAGEADFNAWYTRQHLSERVGVPGFLNGRRYELFTAEEAPGAGNPRYFAAYDTESVATLSSPAYLERLNDPTPWTTRVMPVFRNTVRQVCRIVGERGRGTGGILYTWRLEPAPGRREGLRDALRETALETLAGLPDVLRVRLGEAALDAPAAGTAESVLREPDAGATFVLLVEGSDPEALQAACGEHLSPQRLADLGTVNPVLNATYRLLYALGG